MLFQGICIFNYMLKMLNCQGKFVTIRYYSTADFDLHSLYFNFLLFLYLKKTVLNNHFIYHFLQFFFKFLIIVDILCRFMLKYMLGLR